MAEKAITQFETVIQTAIDSALKEVHTCLPAVVTKVNHATQLIDAQPTIQRKMAGKLVNLPLLVNVPIRYLRSATFSITFPIEVDDHVEIRFCERSIDTWLTEGGIQNPFDFRKFSLSDAFATPAMYHQKDVIPNFDPINLEIKTNDGATSLKLTPSGDILLNGDADSVTAFADMKTAFDQLVTDFNNFVSAYNGHGHTPSVVPQGVPTTADMSAAEVTDVKVS